MNFRATANSAHIYRERTSAEIATMNSASVSDSFAEIAKNSVVVHDALFVLPITLPPKKGELHSTAID